MVMRTIKPNKNPPITSVNQCTPRYTLEKWQVINIVRDVFLGATARFLEQLFKIVGGPPMPQCPPNKVEQLLKKTRPSTED